MRSISSRAALLAVTALLAVSAITQASAATRQRRAAPVAPSADIVGLPIQPAWSAIPARAYQQPNSCYTDEGYGRYTSCEQGGF